MAPTGHESSAHFMPPSPPSPELPASAQFGSSLEPAAPPASAPLEPPVVALPPMPQSQAPHCSEYWRSSTPRQRPVGRGANRSPCAVHVEQRRRFEQRKILEFPVGTLPTQAETSRRARADIILKTSLLKLGTAMVLHTPRLQLRDFTESDAVEANSYESDPAVVRYATHGVMSFTDSLAYIQGIRADARSKVRRLYEFAIVRSDHSQLIGRCGIRLSDAEQTEAMLWYVLAQDAWGHGYAAEAAQAVLAFGFEELRLHRIFVEIDPRNAASLRVAEKVGLRREGHFVETTWTKGEWTDSVVFALLDREYRVHWHRAPVRATRRG